VIYLTTIGRGGLDFEGIRYGAVTCKASADLISAWNSGAGRSSVIDKAVTLKGNGIVGFGDVGDPLFGKINQYEHDNHVTVQDAGYTEFEGVSGSLPTTYGACVVVSNGAVMTSTGAVGVSKVVSVDSTNQKVMVLIG
jgi:hypothetical protein